MTSALASWTKRPAFSTACSGETWKLQYGMSTILRPYWLPRSIALAIIITSSKVTVTVVAWPNRIMPPVSGTHRMSMSRRSAMTALR